MKVALRIRDLDTVLKVTVITYMPITTEWIGGILLVLLMVATL